MSSGLAALIRSEPENTLTKLVTVFPGMPGRRSLIMEQNLSRVPLAILTLGLGRSASGTSLGDNTRSGCL